MSECYVEWQEVHSHCCVAVLSKYHENFPFSQMILVLLNTHPLPHTLPPHLAFCLLALATWGPVVMLQVGSFEDFSLNRRLPSSAHAVLCWSIRPSEGIGCALQYLEPVFSVLLMDIAFGYCVLCQSKHGGQIASQSPASLLGM